ncbi:MAG: glycoside hydrolase family 76 protein, partial [Lachnospiraceae bacterium]|nr:glycoside hydrolase family 76 protein [Lachnospiraceae bacterium]
MRDFKKILLTLGATALITVAGCGGGGNGGAAEPVTTGTVEATTPTSVAETPTATYTPTPVAAVTKKPESEDKNLKKGTIEEAAYESFSSFIDQYYFKSKIEDYGVFKKLNFWDQAEIYEIVIDAYEHTGDERYYRMIHELFNGFIKLHGEDFSPNEYNDDIMWITIAFVRAYRDTGDEAFLESAVRHFNLVWDRGWSEDLGGGIFWRIENTTKNACINCPAAIAACLLAEETHDDSYYEKAVMIMDWVVDNIYETKTGRVYDAYEMNGNKNHWASTYNQGTFIGANTLLYLHTGDGKYLSQARRASDFTIENMYDGKVMDNEANSGDLVGFKGILARWMYAFA